MFGFRVEFEPSWVRYHNIGGKTKNDNGTKRREDVLKDEDDEVGRGGGVVYLLLKGSDDFHIGFERLHD